LKTDTDIFRYYILMPISADNIGRPIISDIPNIYVYFDFDRCAHGPRLTGLPGDDHGLHDEGEQLVQQQVQVEHQGLQAGGGQRHDAQLQLLLQLVLGDLLVAHAQRERGAALQRAAQREETLKMVVLEETQEKHCGCVPKVPPTRF